MMEVETTLLKRPDEPRSPRSFCFARKSDQGQTGTCSPAEPHLLGRPVFGRLRPSATRMIPMPATISPTVSHIRLPVMKLPGIRFIPCPANTPPMITAIKPMAMRAMRPTLLFTLPSLLLTASCSWETALRSGPQQSAWRNQDVSSNGPASLPLPDEPSLIVHVLDLMFRCSGARALIGTVATRARRRDTPARESLAGRAGPVSVVRPPGGAPRGGGRAVGWRY